MRQVYKYHKYLKLPFSFVLFLALRHERLEMESHKFVASAHGVEPRLDLH